MSLFQWIAAASTAARRWWIGCPRKRVYAILTSQALKLSEEGAYVAKGFHAVEQNGVILVSLLCGNGQPLDTLTISSDDELNHALRMKFWFARFRSIPVTT